MGKLAAMASRLRWFLGAALPWVLAWALLGVRALAILKESPQPFLPEVPIRGPILQAIVAWAREALVIHLVLGLCLSLVLHLWGLAGQREKDADPLGFLGGLWTGLASLFLFHGLLYWQVPMALHSLHGVRALPIGLSLLLMLALGGGALVLAYRRFHGRWTLLRVAGGVLSLALLSHLPHDLFRRSLAPAPLPDQAPRLLILGMDGLRKDLADRYRPEWRPPAGLSPVPSIPATRKAWLTLLGSDPAYAMNAMVIPTWKEFLDRDGMVLVSRSRAKGIRTAWAINDPTTLSFGLLQNRFDQISEPPGGWTYWFMLGFGTLWPANTWAQNFISPIETTNTWSEREAFYRDLERLLAGNHWTSAHNVELHVPILLHREELMELEGGWRWLLQPARVYRPFLSASQAIKDDGRTASWRNDAERHYAVRIHQALDQLAPLLDRWTARYPRLSGVFTSDHGEFHLPVQDPQGSVVTHLSGIHGFIADPDTLWIPLHLFGQARYGPGRPQTVSWFDLRDAIRDWVEEPKALLVQGNPEGWMIRFPTVDPSPVTGTAQAGPGPGSPLASGGGERGMKISQIARTLLLSPQGYWFVEEDAAQMLADGPQSTALIQGAKLTTFNPVRKGVFQRTTFDGYRLVDSGEVDAQAQEDEVRAFKGSSPQALAPVGSLRPPAARR